MQSGQTQSREEQVGMASEPAEQKKYAIPAQHWGGSGIEAPGLPLKWVGGGASTR